MQLTRDMAGQLIETNFTRDQTHHNIVSIIDIKMLGIIV